MKKIFITGGAGYVGSRLTEKLLNKGHHITVYDLFLYGDPFVNNKENLKKIKGDIRDIKLLKNSIGDNEILIHLACISNDPSFELNPKLGKEINFDCFEPLVKTAKKNGVKQFIYASSSSVYGIKKELNVVESMDLSPLTDYSKYKADCEDILISNTNDNFLTTILRPATVCGYSKRLRLDLVVNILTNHAYYNKTIKVFGGKQLRPNIHIDDMVDAYILLVEKQNEISNGEIYNVGHLNHSVEDLALIVKSELNEEIDLTFEKTDDNRSYHICSSKIKDHLGFSADRKINTAVNDLIKYFKSYPYKDTFQNTNFHNIKKMMEINMQ